MEDVLRQDSNKLINCIKELECGIVSTDTYQFLTKMDRPINAPEHKVVHLFAQKLDVQMFNELRLGEVQACKKTFRAQDKKFTNFSRSLVEKHITTPRCVRLKVGAPVLLTYNVDVKMGLVNGLHGTVVKFLDDRQVVVNFGNMLSEVVIKPVEVSLYDPKQNKVGYTRQQIPLILAYAMTVLSRYVYTVC